MISRRPGTRVNLDNMQVIRLAVIISAKTNLKGMTVSAPSKAGVSKLDNPAWLKVSHRARTELCV